jgi:serine/threonine-protein kinase
MGSVWVADHLTLHTEVAVKFLAERAQGVPEAIARFSVEAAAAARIKSPHVVQVFDHGVSDEGTPYIVMELLEGEDLAHRLTREGRLPLPETVTVIGQVCKALERAHAMGIIHRDIKPANLFLLSTMGETFVKVLDFGLAKSALEMAAGMTGSGAIFGTPHYVSPEQAESARTVTAQSDLWSVAVVAYECLTGRRPFEGESLMGLCVALQEGRFTSPTTVCPELPAEAESWFKRAFARDPSDRFASATELAASFTALLALPPSPDPPRIAWSDTAVRPPWRSHRAVGIAGALAVAGMGIFLLRPTAEPAALPSSGSAPSSLHAPPALTPDAPPVGPAPSPSTINSTSTRTRVAISDATASASQVSAPPPARRRSTPFDRPPPSAVPASTTKHELFSDPKN